MKRNYSHALALTLKHEGHFVNNPHDKGGPTNEGITLATYRADIDPQGTVDSLKNISQEQVATEYRKKYWDKVRGDDLPDGLDFAMFDYAVLSSPLRAIRALQSVAGVVADGKLTNATLAAVLAIDTVKIIRALSDYRLDYLKGLSDWQYFGKGWQNRVEEVRGEALSIAHGAIAPLPEKLSKPEVVMPTPVVPVPTPTLTLPKSLDKPVSQSHTIWAWFLSGLGGAISGFGHLFGGLDWRVQMFLSIAIVCLAIYGIKRRVELFEAVKDIKKEIGV